MYMLDFNWYNELLKPWLSPPPWIFRPVWVILYVLIAISLITYLIKCRWMDKSSGVLWFIVQLILNLLWTPVFFGMKNIGLALVVILFLDYAVYRTMLSFYSVSLLCGRLLIPYFLWILFATYLTGAMFFLN